MSQSPSDSGTANTDEVSPQVNHTVGSSDKYTVAQVKQTYDTFIHVGFSFHFSDMTLIESKHI